MEAWMFLALLEPSAAPPGPALPDLDRVIHAETSLQRCPESLPDEIVVCRHHDATIGQRFDPGALPSLPDDKAGLDEQGLFHLRLGPNIELVGGGTGAGIGLRLRF